MKKLTVGSLLLFTAVMIGTAAAHNGEFQPPPGRTKPPPGGKTPTRPGTGTPGPKRPSTPRFDGPETTPGPRSVVREEALPWELVWELLRDGEPEPPAPRSDETATRVRDALIGALGDANLEVRIHAALALARGNDVGHLLPRFADDGALLRSIAAIAPGLDTSLDDDAKKRIRTLLGHAIEDPDGPELSRAAAAIAVGRTGPGGANLLLKTIGRKPPSQLRGGCLFALGLSGHPGAYDVLLPEVLPAAPGGGRADAGLRRALLVHGLSRLGAVKVERDLVKRLRDPDQGVRAAAAMSLSSRVISSPAARAALVDLAKSGRVRPRSAALLSLTLAGDRIAPELAKAAIVDPTATGSGLPELGALCLGLLRAAEAGPDLVTIAADDSRDAGIRAAAALAAGLVRARGGADDLTKLLAKERDPLVAGYAAIGLALLAPDVAVKPVLKRLHSEKRYRTRRLLIQALGRTTGEKTVVGLVAALGDEYEVNREAIRSLFRADPPRAVEEALLRLADAENAFARRFAVLALSRARDRTWPSFYARVLLGTALDTRDPLVALLLYLESDLLHSRWGGV